MKKTYFFFAAESTFLAAESATGAAAESVVGAGAAAESTVAGAAAESVLPSVSALPPSLQATKEPIAKTNNSFFIVPFFCLLTNEFEV
ncbi:hypothetical protein [Niastella vici]|uniref:hypothetical protein n=1 Tax=Niastella vici TaxID=1703345 RepID=UPI001301E723|nr:hypothetical protein [Niastella vici]